MATIAAIKIFLLFVDIRCVYLGKYCAIRGSIVLICRGASLPYGEQIQVTSFFNLIHDAKSGAAPIFWRMLRWQRYVLILLAVGISA